MSIRLMAALWRTKLELNSTQKFVLMALCDLANDDGASCYPSYGLVALMCNLSKRTVIRIVSELNDMRLVNTHEIKKPDGSSKTNMYFINAKKVMENMIGGGDRGSLGGDTGSLGGVTEDHPILDHHRYILDNNIYILDNNKYILDDSRLIPHIDPKKTKAKKDLLLSSLNTKRMDDAKTIILFLNEKTGKNFRSNTKAHLTKIVSRLKEGYTVQDFKTMIVKKCKEWLMTDMDKYLNPQTLFRDANFDKYMAECVTEEERKSRIEKK